MKLSLSWIGEYVTLPADLDLKKLAYDLTMSTVEVEDVEYLARRFDKMVVGVINSVEPHPNADKLRVCKVDLGGDVKEIVCGGINLRDGMRVAVADDLLATGGTALAACRLAEQLGGKVVAVRFAIELEGMGGREKLRDYDVDAVMTFPGD